MKTAATFWRFLKQVVPTGARSVGAFLGLIALLIGGSALNIFQVNFWLGAWIVTLSAGAAVIWGTFRLWESNTTELAVARGSAPPTLPDALRVLYEKGVRARQKVEEDPDWGKIHTNSGLAAWVESVFNVLNVETPTLALWFHQMNSPAPRPPLGDSLKARQMNAFDWSLARLADIEAIIRINANGGPRSPAQKRLILVEQGLHLLQEIQLVRPQVLSIWMTGMPEKMGEDEANAAIRSLNLRSEKLLIDLVGEDKASDLLRRRDNASGGTAIRPGIDPDNVSFMNASEAAIRSALGNVG